MVACVAFYFMHNNALQARTNNRTEVWKIMQQIAFGAYHANSGQLSIEKVELRFSATVIHDSKSKK